MSLSQKLRIVTLACCAAGTAFWFYTFYFISQLPAGDGTGFQWIAEMPLSGIFLFLIVPALLLGIRDRTVPISTILAIIALILYAILWSQLLTEFADDDDQNAAAAAARLQASFSRQWDRLA
jgi:sensor domain CHASE-containing protein